MRFEFVVDQSIPIGAWALSWRLTSATVQVRHGALVELFDDGFFFGVWAGAFGDGSVDLCADRMGTGAVIRDGQLKLVSPSHPLDGVMAARSDGRFVASNSLPMLLHETRAAPHLRTSDYFRRFHDLACRPFVDGEIEFDGSRVQPLRTDSFSVAPDGSLRRQRVARQRWFDDFASYRAAMTDVLREVADNSSSPHRRTPLGRTIAVSAGYDSLASAALARSAGWQDAFAFAAGPDDPDDGTAITQSLGYRVTPCAYDAWQQRPMPEIDFLTVVGPDGQARFAGADHLAERSVMLVGASGDFIWDATARDLGPRLERQRAFISGPAGMAEWCLTIGAVHVSVPWILAEDDERLRRLAAAPEMEPWTLHTDYDRPIARRIIESAGIPRGTFARVKRAGSHVMFPRDLTDASRADFDAWLDDHRDRLTEVANRVSTAVSVRMRRARGEKIRALSHSRLRWTSGHLFHWAIDRTRPRYEHDTIA